MAKKTKKEIEKKVETEAPKVEEKVVYETEVAETEGEGTVGDKSLSKEEMEVVVENNEKDFDKVESTENVNTCTNKEEKIVEQKHKIENKEQPKKRILTTKEMFGYQWMGQIYSE